MAFHHDIMRGPPLDHTNTVPSPRRVALNFARALGNGWPRGFSRRNGGLETGAVALPEPWPPIAAAHIEEEAASAVILMTAAAHQGMAGSYAAACPGEGGMRRGFKVRTVAGAMGPAVQVEKEAAHGGAVRCVGVVGG